MSKSKKFVVLLFFGILSLLMMVSVIRKPRIFILQSYYNDYSWTQDVDSGLRRVLGNAPKYALRWYYMDTKRHPWREFKDKAGIAARNAIDSWRPDVLIAVDDDAQQFVARHYARDPHVSVVFAGVNEDAEAYGYDQAGNVTGILERQKLDAVKAAILEIAKSRGQQSPIRVLDLGDTSETVRADVRHHAAYDWAPLVYTGGSLVGTFEDWKNAVTGAAGKADFIVTTNYRGLARSATDRTLVPPDEVVGWTQQNSAPFVIGTYTFFVQDGGSLAIATSPFEQGEVAARMALEIVGGTPARDVPVDVTHQFVVAMRGDDLKRRHITLPAIYEAFAKATKNYH